MELTPRLKRNLLTFVLILIVGSIIFIQSKKPHVSNIPSGGDIVLEEELLAVGTSTDAISATSSPKEVPIKPVIAPKGVLSSKKMTYPRAKELALPSGFINTDPFLIKDYIGKKVILVDFWTYSCINCQRTTPYLNSWYSKYKDKGLVIIGVHTPEFDFEKQKDNVDRAVQKFGIRYPVVLDNEYGTWGNYGNRYWPHEYLIDIDGFITHDHIGEGDYDITEKAIQNLLIERANRLGEKNTIDMSLVTPADVITLDASKRLSPETYFGAERNEYLGNGKPLQLGVQTFTPPALPTENILYLKGSWSFAKQSTQSMAENSGIIYRYNAKHVYMVAGAEKSIRVKVTRDGKPLDETIAGKDILFEKGESYFMVNEERLYDIVNDQAGYGTHTLEFTAEKGGLNVFTFTFG